MNLKEAKQHVLDLAIIGTNIDHVTKELDGIENPSESEFNIITQEISSSDQDLVRLALNYAQKWKNDRSISFCYNSEFDNEIATSVPESSSTDHQYLFHQITMERMESERQTRRKDKLLKQELKKKHSSN
ncbi:hypothetical protein AYI68_g7901 [Smittium mucronatum]|uniref:Uncharacterized protein n=1 Tax=Smittium mucronatum TaxID=133383 RepID=A0A1R0GMF1_9FUNG|nr:hypothetical protein AYI68_g7901 [Smittium mucronatum]